MKVRPLLAPGLALLWLVGCGGSSSVDRATPQNPATNPDGNPTTQVMETIFDPSGGNLPFPTNLLLSGSGDLTLNPPVADPTDFGDPAVALSQLDGFSTVTPWTFSFSQDIDPNTVNANTVRFFEVEFVFGTIAVAGINRELVPGVDYVATVDPSGRTIAVVPLRPLQQMTGYMVVATNGILDTVGTAATPSQTYFITKRSSPLVDGSGNSTDTLFDNATARALEPLRQLTNAQEAAAASAGVNPADIVLSFTGTTQAITPVLSAIRSQADPTSITVAQACPAPEVCLTTADVLPPGASPGIADVYIGMMEVPYYLGVPTAEDPTAPITDFWTAQPGAYVPPFSNLDPPLDPNSTAVTVANPFPVQTSTERIPVIMTVPNASSGRGRPDSGWPVVIFQHGITGNRTQMLAIADAFASQGLATIAIDQPLHGITDLTNPFYVGNTPFGVVARERTFNLDLQNNETGAPGPDSNIDSSGAWFINLPSLLTSRDNNRQAQTDLSILALNIPFIDLDGDQLGDIDGSSISFTGLSLGSINGIPFLAVEPTVNNAVLSVPGGGIAQMLNGSQTFGPVVRGGLQAAGIEPGSADFNQFLLIAQTVLDSADPINWGATTAQTNSVLLHQVAGDAVIPNAVPGAPLSGTEPLIRVMGLDAITEAGQIVDPAGIRGAVRFIQGSHGSLLDPTASLAVTVEMQTQATSMAASGGAAVVVGDTSLIQTD